MLPFVAHSGPTDSSLMRGKTLASGSTLLTNSKTSVGIVDRTSNSGSQSVVCFLLNFLSPNTAASSLTLVDFIYIAFEFFDKKGLDPKTIF